MNIEQRPWWYMYFAHAYNDVNPQILRMLEVTFSLGYAHIIFIHLRYRWTDLINESDIDSFNQREQYFQTGLNSNLVFSLINAWLNDVSFVMLSALAVSCCNLLCRKWSESGNRTCSENSECDNIFLKLPIDAPRPRLVWYMKIHTSAVFECASRGHCF